MNIFEKFNNSIRMKSNQSEQNLKIQLEELKKALHGDLFLDDTMRTLYATDASAYREMPLAVVIPKTEDDIKTLITFANEHKTSLIPRTAGTSLAGQVVGNGIVVDVSKHFTKILEVNQEECWVRVQPAVVRDELNIFLKEYDLMFGPETSTANRAMIGGMVGNNSCGSNSVVYGSTRDHLLEVKGFLSDGENIVVSHESLVVRDDNKHQTSNIEHRVTDFLNKITSDPEIQAEIHSQFPKPTIKRRNTGYALDLATPNFGQSILNLLAGSEGTLMFMTEIKLNLVPLPPKHIGLVCVHFNSIDESLRANLIALGYKPSAVELIDHYILECTKTSPEQSQNRFFVQGDPNAILVVELARDTKEEVEALATQMEAEMRAVGLGYHFPILFGDDTKKIWTLRKAGLGLLSNLPGDEKAVAVIEDTAVDVHDLPDFIREFNEILEANKMSCVHYAHAGSGELHLRPIINLKTAEGHRQFRLIAEEISTLVKKYKGSLSGEHGDGRLRGEFIRQQVGEKNYALMKELKAAFDPNNIFNPNKIVDTPPMDKFLRYEAGQNPAEPATVFRYHNQNMLQHAEQCNGSGDCRKTELTGGTMCPSYMATRSEKETTRARANILREYFTSPPAPLRMERGAVPPPSEGVRGRLEIENVKEVLDLCLLCKGCKGECPSNVDMAKLKMEFLQSYHDAKGVPARSWLIGHFSKMSKIASYIPWAYNFVYKTPFLRKIANNFVGFHPERTIPLLSRKSLVVSRKIQDTRYKTQDQKQVGVFIDEFSLYNDGHLVEKTIDLLERLGYEVVIPEHVESGRPQLSKGFLREAKVIAEKNVRLLKDVISAEMPLIGIEPSAILTFRDEYPDLVADELVEAAQKLAKNTLTLDEFLAQEMDKGNIKQEQFTQENKLIKLHGHCQQKAIASLTPMKKVLSLPKNYQVQLIPSGCCGMAGSFGYEKEHYDISMQIGELVLFPTIRKQAEDVIIAAAGTSCRHQIHDGTGRTAEHPVEILLEALNK